MNEDLGMLYELATLTFEYDEFTGELKWRRNHTRGLVGSLAGCPDSEGYLVVTFAGKLRKVHRMIWLLKTGEFPYKIDHIDGNPSNNKWVNLREVTTAQNGANRKLSKNSKSGVKGVTKQGNYWMASIQSEGKRIHKCFPLTEEGKQLATSWLRETREHLHGEFTNHGDVK